MGSLCTRLVLENMVFHRKRRSLLHPNPAQRSVFPLQSYSIPRKLQEKMPRKALVNTKRNVLMLPGHPIILLKSNLYQYGDRNGKKVYWNSIK